MFKNRFLGALGVLALLGGSVACSSSSGGGGAVADAAMADNAGTDNGTDNGTDSGTDPTDGTEGGAGTDSSGGAPMAVTPTEAGPDCGFDESLQGKIVGRHVKNFGLKTYEGNPYWLHGHCGHPERESKAVWIILATGW